MESQTRLLTGQKGMEGIAALLLSGILVGCATGVPSGGTVQPVAATKPSRESHVNFQLQGTIEEVEDGDTVTIKADGQIFSSNEKFQGTLQQVIEQEDNMQMVMSTTSKNGLPVQYNVYVLAATWYRQQYPDDFK